MSSTPFVYSGQELESFSHAEKWKSYWAGFIRRWVGGDVLEVGTGLGVNTPILQTDAVHSWLCVEADAVLAKRTAAVVSSIARCSVRTGTIGSCAGERYDTILYIDVLEHIQADRAELEQAAELLRPGGHLIVLSPAHEFLFSEFDSSIGHVRRYNKKTLRSMSPAGCRIVAMFYLDSAGTLLLLANRILLHSGNPSVSQIRFWDRYVVPVSRIVDSLIGRRYGKTIIAVWQREIS